MAPPGCGRDVLSRPRHGAEHDGLTPINVRILRPDVLAEKLRGVVEFVVSVDIVDHAVDYSE